VNRRRLVLAAVLIATYGLASIAFSAVFPDLSDDPIGAHLDAFYLGFALLFVVVIAATKSWRAVGLVGRDTVPALRWVQTIFVVELVALLGYFALGLLGYSGQEGATWLVLVNLAAVAFNEEVLFRGFLWSAADGYSPARRIVVISLIFGAFHIVNAFTGESLGSTIFQVVLVFFASLLDGVIRYGTGSLWPTIVLHFLWDASGVLGEGGLGGALGPLLQFAIIVAGFVGVAVLAQQRSAPPASSAPPSV
jgi:membrane protease YdiL (CAAX protease family)